MGYDEDISAIAWGLSLERPTMIKYNINNIRDLVGPTCDMDLIHSCEDILLKWNPISICYVKYYFD